MWWKQEQNVTGFLTLANTTPQPMNTVVEIEDNHAAVLGTHRITIPPQGMTTLDLLELETAPSDAGGIRVSYVGGPDGLLISGGLEDIGTGYSANLPFTAPVRPIPHGAHPLTPLSFAELGLMTGPADPWMNFPEGTVFTPYSVIRNISTSPITAAPTLWWMQGDAPVSFQLPSIRVLPSQTYSVDMPFMLAAAGLKNFSGSVNLVLDTQDQTGLLMAAGSVDQNNTYVFEVASRSVVKSAGKSLSYWSTGNGDDTMVTIWNPTDEAQTFIFRLMFAGGHYDDLMTLGPRETKMFDISEVIASAGADPEGNIIPTGTQEGSVKILGLEAENQSILLAVDSGIYNVRKATCYQNCPTCDGATVFSVSLDPFGVAVGDQTQESLIAQWNTGAQYDYTSSGSWSSSNTSVATVPQPGLAKGVSPGEFTLTTGVSDVPVYAPNYCAPPGCPLYGGGSGEAPGDVVSVVCTPTTRGGITTCTASAPQGSTYSLWTFTDSSGNPVNSSTTGNTWSGVAVQSGVVTVLVKTPDGGTKQPQAPLLVTARSNFAFKAVNPSPISGNSITCYGGATTVLPSPPASGSIEGYSCADLAFSFNYATISDGGPNNGYEYVTSASDASGSSPTQFQYIVVSDLASGTAFYNAQCGNFSASDSSGFIAGAQLQQNVQNHEAGSVLSHWTEYRDAQNNNSNNIGVALESATAPPGSTGSSFALTAGNAALGRIHNAVTVEPCGGDVRNNSSNSCGFCGIINFSPYASCGGVQPVGYCQ